MEMKGAVILSEAKDLHFRSGELTQIPRFAQNDRLSSERSEESGIECFDGSYFCSSLVTRHSSRPYLVSSGSVTTLMLVIWACFNASTTVAKVPNGAV